MERLGSNYRQRLQTALLTGSSAAGGVALWLSWRHGEAPIFWGCLVALVVGFLLTFIPGARSAHRNTGVLLARLGFSVEPFQGSVWVEAGRVHWKGNANETAFELTDLREARIDRGYLQLDFYSGGLLTIPETAFSGTGQRDEFLALVKNEQKMRSGR